ncbi:MAG: sulfotransferase family 2 domain-containing protein [Pseudomonadales bacterium]
MISDDPSFIFIAVPKTGSCSIEEALKPWENKQRKQKFSKHATAMRLNRELPATRWEQSYRFAIVREPYAWMHSWYRFRQREELKNPEHEFNKRYTGNIGFDEFVQSFSANELMLKQSDFIARRNGDFLVDFVGHYEPLQNDFDSVCEHLALP